MDAYRVDRCGERRSTFAPAPSDACCWICGGPAEAVGPYAREDGVCRACIVSFSRQSRDQIARLERAVVGTLVGLIAVIVIATVCVVTR